MDYLKYALWALLSGSLIPILGIINGRLGRTMEITLHAPVIASCICLLFCFLISLVLTQSLPDLGKVSEAKPLELFGGLILGFYLISATIISPRIGVVNFIVFIVVAQIFTSVVIDHFGLFGATIRPVSMLRLLGVGLLIMGVVITQLANSKTS